MQMGPGGRAATSIRRSSTSGYLSVTPLGSAAAA